MTLCFFSAQYLPTVGGVERYTYNLAKACITKGHKAVVVTSALAGLPARARDENGIEIFRLPVWPLMHGRFPVPKPGKEFRALTRELWSLPIDFVCIQTRFYPASLYAARAAAKRGIPSLVIDHSTGHMPMGGGLARAAGHVYEHLACRLQRRWCGAYYGVSEAVCAWLSHFGAPVRGTLYNAIDPAAMRTLLADAPAFDWRASLGLSPGTKLVAFVGRVIPEKGVRELIAAFARLGRADAALVVAGDGPLLAALRAACPEHVYFAGAVPYPKAMQLLQQADVYCLPTYYAEGFPTTFLEAAVCGCAVVAARTGGTDELFPDERCGLCLAAQPLATLPARLADALQKALADDAWRAEAAARTQARAEALFTWDAVSEKLLEIARCATQESRKEENA